MSAPSLCLTVGCEACQALLKVGLKSSAAVVHQSEVAASAGPRPRRRHCSVCETPAGPHSSCHARRGVTPPPAARPPSARGPVRALCGNPRSVGAAREHGPAASTTAAAAAAAGCGVGDSRTTAAHCTALLRRPHHRAAAAASVAHATRAGRSHRGRVLLTHGASVLQRSEWGGCNTVVH